MHTCIHAYMHTCIHAYMHTCIHTCMHTYTHTYIHTYIYTNIHTCIHKLVYIHNILCLQWATAVSLFLKALCAVTSAGEDQAAMVEVFVCAPMSFFFLYMLGTDLYCRTFGAACARAKKATRARARICMCTSSVCSMSVLFVCVCLRVCLRVCVCGRCNVRNVQNVHLRGGGSSSKSPL